MANPVYEFDRLPISRRGRLGCPDSASSTSRRNAALTGVTLLCEKEQVQALAQASTKWRASSRRSSSWRAFLPWRWMK